MPDRAKPTDLDAAVDGGDVSAADEHRVVRLADLEGAADTARVASLRDIGVGAEQASVADLRTVRRRSGTSVGAASAAPPGPESVLAEPPCTAQTPPAQQPPRSDGALDGALDDALDDGERRARFTGRSRRRGGSDGRGGGPGERRAERGGTPAADPVAVAREICLRLLAERARTRQELAVALRKRDVPDEAAAAVLERFDEVGLIDDAAFAGQWVRARHTGRGLARRAIAVELRRKGVDDDLAHEALAEVDSAAEERRARELVDRKLRTMPTDTADQRTSAAKRLVGMLGRRGYPGGIAYRVVRAAIGARCGDDDELGPVPDL